MNVLNTAVLRRVLGLTDQQLASGEDLEYTHSAVEAVETVMGGDTRMAFVMNPTSVSDVIDVSNEGDVLPRKSTFFYPKPVSGMVFYPMDDPENA